MRDIIKNIRLSIDGTDMDFRLKKLDAFSGASLLQLLARTKAPEGSAESTLSAVFAALSPEELRSVMTSCLNHIEVLLPAGYQPVMQGTSWTWPELEHDAASCLKLTLEEVLWTLSGFFGEGGTDSRPAGPDSIPPAPQT